MNSSKKSLLKNLIIAFAIFIFGVSCDGTDAEGFEYPTSEWTIVGKGSVSGDPSKLENNILYAEAHAGMSKLSIKFGGDPKTPGSRKIVDYFKVPLAADEVIIGIKDGSSFYLSTGTDNLTIDPIITTDVNTNTLTNIRIKFTNVRVQRHDTQFNPFEVTNVTGYINLVH